MNRSRPRLLVAVLATALFAATPSHAAAQTHAPGEHATGAGVEAAAASITAEDLHRRVAVLAHDSMRGRDTPSPELEQAARWIADDFRRFGLRPEGMFEGSVVVVRGAGEPDETLTRDVVEGRHVVVVASPTEAGARTPAVQPIVRAVFSLDPASILVATRVDDEAWAREIERQRQVTSTRLGGSGAAGLPFPVLEARDRALAPLLAAHGVELAELREGTAERVRALPLPDLRFAIEPAVRVLSDDSAPNVVGILEGSDPELRDEYLVYSAHMDHVGVGRADASGDSIYNGTDDDASGTAAVIEVAEAMSMLDPAPRRSVIFLLVSGEEKGLWGSGYFAENPPVPVESMVANLNADMVGRNWPDTIVAIGREHSDLGRTLATVNAHHPELGMTAIDDIWPEERFYFRSDHYNFARRGVPVLFFFNGTHEDYHRPSDEVEAIDAGKASRVARLLFYLGRHVADAEERPRWDPESYRQIVERGGA